MKSVSWKLHHKQLKEARFLELLALIAHDKVMELSPQRDARTWVYIKDGTPVAKAVYHSMTGLYNIYDVK